ncbi:hypothetical protein DL98DRAFT_522798 [Cadophora sp. DSE1049]|nr:hypothetical protein DL98DRAFT_522798 [Cadophora sp. DSE1049]
MARRRSRRKKDYTPPPDLAHDGTGQVDTPARTAVIVCKLVEQELNVPIPCALVQKISGVPPRSQSRTLTSHSPRKLEHRPDSGPDPREGRSKITRNDTAAIFNHVDNPATSMKQKGLPWGDVARDAGVMLPQTIHFFPSGKRQVSEYTIRKRCAEDEDMINAVAEEERELTKDQAKNREDWRVEQQEERPYPEDWFNTVHCDEFHVGIGTQTTNRIKRKRGKEHRYAPHNVHRKKISSKDVKAKAREDAHLKLFNVFVLVGYNYRKMIPYDTGKAGGKMNSKCYTEQILPQILDDFRSQGLILVHDSDSAHLSEETTRWVKSNNLKVLTLPGVSPDFSVFESFAAPLKKRFHAVRSASYEGALKRFHKVFMRDIPQESVQNLFNTYPRRLAACKEREGQMTKY